MNLGQKRGIVNVEAVDCQCLTLTVRPLKKRVGRWPSRSLDRDVETDPARGSAAAQKPTNCRLDLCILCIFPAPARQCGDTPYSLMIAVGSFDIMSTATYPHAAAEVAEKVLRRVEIAKVTLPQHRCEAASS